MIGKFSVMVMSDVGYQGWTAYHMIQFERYPLINDLFQHYMKELGDDEISRIMCSGVLNEKDAEKLSNFVWNTVEKINEDEENKVMVLGGMDNTEMLPDLNYEITKYMKKVGFYSVWEKISDSNM